MQSLLKPLRDPLPTQLCPDLLDWAVHPDGSMYFCLKVPTLSSAMWAFPVASRKCHITLSYKLQIMLPDSGPFVWQRFWKLKNHMQCKLVSRPCTMLLEKSGGHTFALSPVCELHFICMDLRTVFELDADIAELAKPPDPFHIAWLDIA